MRGADQRMKLIYAIEDYVRVYVFDEDNIDEASDEVMLFLDNLVDDFENREKRLAGEA